MVAMVRLAEMHLLVAAWLLCWRWVQFTRDGKSMMNVNTQINFRQEGCTD